MPSNRLPISQQRRDNVLQLLTPSSGDIDVTGIQAKST